MKLFASCALFLLAYFFADQIPYNIQYRNAQKLIKQNSHKMALDEILPLSTPDFLKQLPLFLPSYEHYPKQDVPDSSGYFFYYHCHRPNEHGHIHLFKKNGASYHHLLAIGFDKKRRPNQLFTTNEWVTEENMASKEQVLQDLEQIYFNEENDAEIKEYIKAIIQLFKPQIYQLMAEKQATLETWINQQEPIWNIKQKSIEILSQIPIDIDMQIKILSNLAKH